MFYVLASALCLAGMFLVLASGSMLCMAGLRVALKTVAPSSAGGRANLFFAARILPLALAFLVTFGLALPAFLEFEPYSTSEGIGFRLLALAAMGALLLVGMVARGISLLRATREAQREWQKHSRRL